MGPSHCSSVLSVICRANCSLTCEASKRAFFGRDVQNEQRSGVEAGRMRVREAEDIESVLPQLHGHMISKVSF